MDENPEDITATFGSDQKLNLDARTVVVHGVPADSTLPASVQSSEEMTAQGSLPIACGEPRYSGPIQFRMRVESDPSPDVAAWKGRTSTSGSETTTSRGGSASDASPRAAAMSK